MNHQNTVPVLELIIPFFSLDYAMFTHNDLGLTHQAGVIISFGRDENRSPTIRKYLGLE